MQVKRKLLYTFLPYASFQVHIYRKQLVYYETISSEFILRTLTGYEVEKKSDAMLF